jgi:hypothetical protein
VCKHRRVSGLCAEVKRQNHAVSISVSVREVFKVHTEATGDVSERLSDVVGPAVTHGDRAVLLAQVDLLVKALQEVADVRSLCVHACCNDLLLQPRSNVKPPTTLTQRWVRGASGWVDGLLVSEWLNVVKCGSVEMRVCV